MKCPNCGYEDHWKRSFHHNPDGDVEIMRKEDCGFKIEQGQVRTDIDTTFAYYLGEKAVWVKRVPLVKYQSGGLSAFNVPYESHRKRE